MKLKHLLFAFVFICSAALYSQDTIFVFKDYASYVNKQGDFYDKMLGYSNGAIKMKIVVEKNKVETTIKCKEIWGFLYNGRLFRTDIRTGQVARLVSQGKICYYENGIANLKMIRDKTETEEFYLGYYCYVSKDLQSWMAPFPSPEVQVSDAHKQIRKFRKEYPEYEKFFNSLNKPYYYQNVRVQVQAFEKWIN